VTTIERGCFTTASLGVSRLKQRLPPLLALLAWALTPAIEAQPESAYYGVSIGEFDYSDRAAGLGVVFNDSVSSWRVTIGYQLSKHFAFEGTYGKTGTVRDTVSRSPGSTEFGFETELSRILGFRALGTLPFDNGLSLMAGVGFLDFEQEIALSFNGAPFLSGEVEKGGQFAYYVGFQYDWDRVALRLSYEKWDFGSGAVLVFVGADAEEIALSFFYKI
jgi:hypothetical protein